jgi:hypothetical protein
MRVKTLFPALLCFLFVTQGCTSNTPQTSHFKRLETGICQDTTSGLMWQSERSMTIATIEEARRYVSTLRLGGYSDWRLPTREELSDLNYLFDLRQNGECDLDREGKYWSMEEDGTGRAGAWEVTANQCDPAREYQPWAAGHVRAVRP